MTKGRDRERARLPVGRVPTDPGRLRQRAELGRAEHVAIVDQQPFVAAQRRVNLREAPDLAVDVEKQRQIEHARADLTTGRERSTRIPLQVPYGLTPVLLERERIA